MTTPAPAELPADAVPVITTDGERLGHVYPAAGAEHAHWGMVTARGYQSPLLCPSQQAAIAKLAVLAGRPDVRCLDTTLTAELARLGALFDPVGVAFAAARLTDPNPIIIEPGIVEAANRAADLVYTEWADRTNRAAYVGDAIRQAAHQAVREALARRTVVPTPPERGQAASRMAQARQWLAHDRNAYLPRWDDLTPEEQEQAETEARHWIQAAVNTGVKIVPTGCTVVELPEPDGHSYAGTPRWDASARRVMAKVDENGRSFVLVDEQIWLDDEAESVGLALVAAAREARRLAGGSQVEGRADG